MSDLRLLISSLTDEVYIGKPNKDGNFLQGTKVNVTNDFIHAVIERWNGCEEIVVRGNNKYKITVKELVD